MPATRTKRAATRPATRKDDAAVKASARERHKGKSRRKAALPKKELRKGPETEVTQEVLDFIRALDTYKKAKNRPFPTWSEVLEVLKQIGYRKVELDL